MAATALEPPYSIASLPRPLDRTHGRIHAAPVYGIRSSRKRKRHEVAVAIDGEGVNVYNAQSQRQVASYALPPQASLCHPPCSVYIRATPSSPARRKTFLIVQDGSNARRRRLLCFTENMGSSKTESPIPEKKECQLEPGDIRTLDAVPTAQDEQLCLIASYATGKVLCISNDVSKIESHNPPQQDDSEESVVEHVAVVDSEAARKGLLRGREDVMAMLDPLASDSTLLCAIVRSNAGRKLQLYSINTSMQHSVQTLNSGMQLLMSYDLPSRQKSSRRTVQYELHAASGELYQLVDNKLRIYTLSGTIPRLTAELGGKSDPVCSFARISATLVVTASKDTATVYETKYGSIRGSVGLPPVASVEMQSKKRKREEEGGDTGGTTPLSLLSCFSELGLVVGVSGTELVALQLDDSSRDHKRSRSQGTNLADVIGKGALKNVQGTHPSEKKKKKWEDWTAKVDALVDAYDIEGLEKLIANDPRLGRQRENESTHTVEEDGIPDGDRVAYEDLWPLPEIFDPETLQTKRVLYILSRVFAQDDSDDGRLEIRIASVKILEWLALTGFLKADSVRKALHAEGSLIDIRTGDIMIAVGQIDDDFQLTQDLLELPVHWEVEEVIQALRLLVHSFDEPHAEESRLALPAPTQTNGDVEMANGDVDSHLELESKAAEHELDHAMTALAIGREVRSHALGAVFSRLQAFDHYTITNKMRDMMSHRELIFFIHVLRIELADGGWTSKYIDVADGQEDEGGMANAMGGAEESGPSDEAIRTIGYLLNSAVDAIGTSGWLVGLSSDQVQAVELLASLRAEVSAGLEGCYEANSLETVIAEILRFAAAAADKTQTPGGDEGDTEMAVLPMGGKGEARGRKGQEGKKSKIALAQEKSRRVGKYSFDRIRI